MKRIGLAVALAISLAVPSSVVAKVTSDATPGANFANYQTFTFINALPPAGMDPVAYERIRQSVEQGLVAKGFTKAAEGGDLSVIITLGAKDKTDIETWGRFGRQVDVHQYTEGQLSVDVFDTKTKQPLWHGQATESFSSTPDAAKLEKVTGQVMAQFPPRA